MSDSIIWLHEDALRLSHPVFVPAPRDARTLHIWDDAYLQRAGYSLKRLVFLYETLCELPLDIIHGDTEKVLRQTGASQIYIPATLNPEFQRIIRALSVDKKVVVVADEPFVTLPKPKDATRFFQYWGKAEKTAFLPNGGADAR